MRLVIAEDLVLLREGLASLLATHGFEVVGTAESFDGLLELVRRERPDVAIVDIRLPPSWTDEGIRAAEEIRPTSPSDRRACALAVRRSDFALRSQPRPARRRYLRKDDDRVERVCRDDPCIDAASP
jgi:DNA-binding NarL/FixJ family response regulator